jgi:hypothetical protein
MNKLAPSTASPADAHLGGNALSVSFLKDWKECNRLFFWRHIFEWPTGERGIEPRYPVQRRTPLARYAQPFGSAFHAAVAAWRLSDWEGGQYDRDAAMAAARATLAGARHLFESDEDYAIVLAELEDLTLRYCARWANEFPDVRVLAIDGKPAVEMLFEVPLGDTGYVLNVRPDALVIAHGYLAAHEIKTASPQRAAATLAQLDKSAQSVAETWVLRMSRDRIGGDIAGIYGDVAVKGNTKTVEKFKRTLITVDEAIVDEFPSLVMDMLAEIGEASAVPFSSLEQGFAAFPKNGMFAGMGGCDGCMARDLCWNPGHEAAALPAFRPRTRRPSEETITTEESE